MMDVLNTYYMKQRLMALTIDFSAAFTTVALLTVNGTIKGHSGPATLRIVERYIGMIQLLNRPEWVRITDERALAEEINTLEYHFRMSDMDDVYCPWAENTSASIDHGDDCDCNDCYMKNEPNFRHQHI